VGGCNIAHAVRRAILRLEAAQSGGKGANDETTGAVETVG
jgi:hypothetical protein